MFIPLLGAALTGCELAHALTQSCIQVCSKYLQNALCMAGSSLQTLQTWGIYYDPAVILDEGY